MLKIAVITRYFPSSAEPWQGKSAFQTLRLIARRADVRVFFPNATYPSFLRPPSRIYDKLDPAYRPGEVDVRYYDYKALPVVSRPFNGQMAAHAVLPHVRAYAPDLIFGIFLYPAGFAALQVGKALSLPVIAMGIGSDINRIEGRASERHTRTLLSETDFLVTVSDDLRRKAVAMGAPAERTRAILNGCDLSTFHVKDCVEARLKLSIDAGAEAIVYIGRIDVKKGLRELIEAAVSLRSHRPKLQVYMVGEGSDRAALQSAVEASDATSYIHLMPACVPNEVPTWMAAADLVTLPSYMEGCPNVVLEALACGRPVVATNVGGIPEIMNDACGRLVPPRDAEALAQGLEAVLDQEWDAAAISASWSRSWSAVADELYDVFDSVASTRQAAMNGR
jgi:teichuronic acid biosynthesis glycosyltransferase TuaC